MGKHRYKTDDDDVALEAYQGPSVAAAAAGEGFVAHWILAGIGLVGGALLTFAFHNQAGAAVARMQGVARKWIGDNSPKTLLGHLQHAGGSFIHTLFGKGEGQLDALRENLRNCIDPNEVKKLERHFVYQEHGFGHWLLDHTIGLIPGVRSLFANVSQRVSTSITVGGLLGALGFFGAPVIWGKRGMDKAREGKHQFERAKEEILDTRAQYEALRERYIDTRLELEDLKTTKAVEAGTLKVAQDDTPTMRESTGTDPLVVENKKVVEHRSDPSGVVTTTTETPVRPPHAEAVKGDKAWSAAMADRAAAQADAEPTLA